MKVWVTVEDIDVEISDKEQRYQPDILEDWCHRAAELVIQQRTATALLEPTHPDPPS